jgi:DNA-binding FadR family transcriptional regulator
VRVSDRVHERLRGDILAGRIAPGDPVPSERVLAEELGVNRHAVREALKRLQQAGLVRISQGGATRVLDWRDSGGLEVMLDLAGEDAVPVELMRSVLEMRASIGVDAARRCAARGSAEARASVAELAARTAESVGVDDAVVDERYAALWQAIVVGSGNIAYRLALNSLLAALAADAEVASALRPSDAAALRVLGDAIEAGDAPRAAEAAHALLEPDTHAV